MLIFCLTLMSYNSLKYDIRVKRESFGLCTYYLGSSVWRICAGPGMPRHVGTWLWYAALFVCLRVFAAANCSGSIFHVCEPQGLIDRASRSNSTSCYCKCITYTTSVWHLEAVEICVVKCPGVVCPLMMLHKHINCTSVASKMSYREYF